MTARLLDSIDRSTQLAGYNRIALLLFRLDERQYFGINVLKVQEVMPVPALTNMPGAHPYIRGCADIRDHVVPVIDMRLAVGQPIDEDARHLIVAEFNRSVQGFLVRAVDRIVHIDVEDLHPPPRGNNGDEGYLTAITRWNQEIIEIIDVERILAEVVGLAPDMSSDTLTQAAVPPGLRVLVADDSRVARSQIQRVLQQLGIEPVLVNDGREALRYLQGLAEQPGAITDKLLMVISDIEMPDMDGYRLTTEIRRDPRLSSLYVMLHTSLSGVFNNQMVNRVGADRFIAKFGADDLAQGILDHVHASMMAA